MKLIAQNTVMVQSALRKTADAEKIAQAWVDHNSTKATTSDDVKRARDWITVHVRFDNSPLERVLNQIWAASYVFGQQDATNELTSTVGFDWDNWIPGNETAALLVKPPAALKALLNRSEKHAKQLSDTTADRIATQLALGLDQGFGPQEIARNIDAELDNPARSLVIARTETADALVQANLATYREAEVEFIEWLVGDPCDDCAQNAGVQVRIGGVFPSGDEAPPAHPNCVCDVAPVVLTMDEMQDSDAFDLAIQPETVKYNPEQERDERGRWTGGYGSSSTSERKDRFHDKTFASGHGIVLSGKELRKELFTKMQNMCVWANTSAGNNEESWEDPEKLFAEMKAEKWAFNNFDMRVLESGFMWRNGNIQITSSNSRYLKDGLPQIIKTVESLQESNPVKALDIRIGERGQLGRDDFAAAIRGGSTMWLSPTKLLVAENMDQIDSSGNGKNGWWMPSSSNATDVESTVSHEWGHLLDKPNNSQEEYTQFDKFFSNNSSLINDNISRYGRTDREEAYAEMFSEWALTSGKTDNPAVQLAAKEFKWK